MRKTRKKIRGNRGRNFTFIINFKIYKFCLNFSHNYNNSTQRYVKAEVKKRCPLKNKSQKCKEINNNHQTINFHEKFTMPFTAV